MKNYNVFYILAFFSLSIFVVSCDDEMPPEEEPTNAITITIEEPTPAEVIDSADCAEVHVHIDIAASIENHEVEIVLHPEGDVDDKIIDYDEHAHDKVITFEQEIDLCSYPSGTCFHLEVAACVDHDCAEKSTADVEFCLQ